MSFKDPDIEFLLQEAEHSIVARSKVKLRAIANRLAAYDVIHGPNFAQLMRCNIEGAHIWRRDLEGEECPRCKDASSSSPAVAVSDLDALELTSGKHLGIMREFIKWRAFRGDSVTWGSNDPVTFNGVTVHDLELLAQRIHDAGI